MEISEIKVERFDLDMNNNHEKLYQLYKAHLVEDQWWHFFREGEYTLIRCEPGRVEVVTAHLEDKIHIMPGQITVTAAWEDNIPVTQENQTAFTYIFHGFSVLAMTIYENEYHGVVEMTSSEAMGKFLGVFDRVLHCFLNVARTDKKIEGFAPFIPIKRPEHLGSMWESMLIVHNALMRTYTIGNYAGKRSMQTIFQDMLEKE